MLSRICFLKSLKHRLKNYQSKYLTQCTTRLCSNFSNGFLINCYNWLWGRLSPNFGERLFYQKLMNKSGGKPLFLYYIKFLVMFLHSVY